MARTSPTATTAAARAPLPPCFVKTDGDAVTPAPPLPFSPCVTLTMVPRHLAAPPPLLREDGNTTEERERTNNVGESSEGENSKGREESEGRGERRDGRAKGWESEGMGERRDGRAKGWESGWQWRWLSLSPTTPLSHCNSCTHVLSPFNTPLSIVEEDRTDVKGGPPFLLPVSRR
ncbi:hypothetical protein BDQ17DRAFT_1413341 [Cyathus striatus]|nr:hypothetical protein BDQ17DRAFT_1413341 [Cyathus striatus]